MGAIYVQCLVTVAHHGEALFHPLVPLKELGRCPNFTAYISILSLGYGEIPGFFSGQASMNVSEADQGNESTLIRGWVSQPNTRGTFDLVVSCAATVFLCSWSSICVNIPTSDHSKWDHFCDKWHMFCLSMLGPEFIFMLALGQYLRAHASMKAFHKKGKKDWTIKHSFYADMGGFTLKIHNWKTFPIDGKQLLYLIERGYINYDDIPLPQIDDKNKSDGLARSVESRQAHGVGSLLTI